ncbi:hypothetical protein CF336_g8737 [Tilletia laevis]|nr:hypothetical protein CF336_g8737 [Tilletia laevis]KAE8240828.1 hypothetical protein A4X03_0g8319 [Tilletia caries]
MAFLVFSTAFYVTLMVTLGVLILHKIYNRSWWVFRVVPRGHSKIIIPNVHTSWVLFMGLYLNILVGSFIASFVSDLRAEPVPHDALWMGIMWVPICFAAWYQTWGITAARIDNGSLHDLPRKSLVRHIPSWLGNIVCLLFPAGPCLAAVVPGVIGNTFLERSRHGWYDWHIKYDGMPFLTREMLVDAQNIFHASICGVYYLSISMTIWGVVCIIFGGAYTFAACSLIMDLRDHLAAKRAGPPLQRFRTMIQMKSARDVAPTNLLDNLAKMNLLPSSWWPLQEPRSLPIADDMTAEAMRISKTIFKAACSRFGNKQKIIPAPSSLRSHRPERFFSFRLLRPKRFSSILLFKVVSACRLSLLLQLGLSSDLILEL